ncbi:MAG: hypothetical protein L0H93_18050, partial [Nocardioides sp.]|nr:hypothetical protein [Nocardioides sp.]
MRAIRILALTLLTAALMAGTAYGAGYAVRHLATDNTAAPSVGPDTKSSGPSSTNDSPAEVPSTEDVDDEQSDKPAKPAKPAKPQPILKPGQKGEK